MSEEYEKALDQIIDRNECSYTEALTLDQIRERVPNDVIFDLLICKDPDPNGWVENELAISFFKGNMKNDKMAFNILYQAQYKKNPYVYNNLGSCYLDGIGTEQNQTEAFRYFQMAASKGHLTAKYHMALCYEDGLGVEKNTRRAYLKYVEAADKGHQLATDRLQLNDDTRLIAELLRERPNLINLIAFKHWDINSTIHKLVNQMLVKDERIS
jgi:hypothetical protein